AAGELRLIDDGNRHLWMVFGATALLVIVRIVISYEGQPFEIAGDNNSYENQVVHYSRKGFDPLFWMLSFPHIMITSHYHIATDIPIVHLFRLLIPLSSLTVAAVGLSSLIATRSQSTFARVAGPLFILFFTCMDYVFTDNPSDNWYGPSRNIFPIQALYNPYPEALAVGVWGLVAIFRKQVYALSDLLLILLLFVPMVYFRPFFFYPFVVGFIVYFVLRIINERKLPKQGAKILLVFACGFLVLLIQYQARKHITQGAWANFPDLKPYWGRLQKWTLETYFPRAPHHTLNVILMMPLHWILGLGVAAIVPLRGLFSKRLLLGADDDSKTSWFFLAAFAGYAVPTVFNFVPDVGHVITHFAMTFYLGMAMVFWMDMWDRLEQSRFGTIWQSLVVLQMILVLPYIMFYSTG
ncbi:MAG: hypothetical protein CMJ21_05210, partial [Phycisphaerae bacterium]|nr:hypothetical protein [Phycisphaerae bacterium]